MKDVEPSWLNQSQPESQKVYAKWKKSNETHNNKVDASKVDSEDTVSNLQGIWNRFNVDEVLADLQHFLGGSRVTDLYISQQDSPIFISKNVSREYEYEDDNDHTRSGERGILSIVLDRAGFRIVMKNGDRKLGLPKNEEELKNKIDKLVSNIISSSQPFDY